ncbi:hypothetical protein B9T25_06000 [Acinetobacter sp. ANC 4470]|uniref:hypothetical protein n=1 Tax=Acinetobacter sp. ANC 4470 TaxID=1977881 RepID=UPI000A3352C4|nr:hypothetical protein [Acinetobacter sp. ANC 4470]OTG68239.1 hypothetical protein B9T25_06000 [Acinetobacter sp. ANC 4470]
MKTLILLAGVILLTACSFGASREVKLAEKMLTHFQCNKIEHAQMTHSSMTNYYEQSLASSRQKAASYVQSYQDGEPLFDLPLTDIIEQQYVIYKAACQNLGGIEPIFTE